MSDDAWGDLFAKAAEVESSTSSGFSPGGGDSSRKRSHENSKRPKQKKSRKRKRDEARKEENDDEEFQEMLQSRIKSPDEDSEWPVWLQLAGPLVAIKNGDDCARWMSQYSSSPPREKYSKCMNCGNSVFNHRVEVAEDARSWPFVAFEALRNLRCTASRLALKYESTRTASSIRCSFAEKENWVSIESVLYVMSQASTELSALKPSIWRQLPEPEARIVDSKLTDVLRQATLLSNSLSPGETYKQQPKTKIQISSHWEPSIRLVTACDALYYRLYYLQIVQLLPRCHHGGHRSFLPHPSHYFGLPYMTSDVVDSESVFNDFVISHLSTDEEDGASEKGGLLGKAKQAQGESGEHPLATIHRCRLAETVTLFQRSGWTKSSSAQELTMQSLEEFLNEKEKHETPAPSVLMEWRDGCRDFLCNLYAYATLSSRALDYLASFLLTGESKRGVIEIGAGTGYIAKLLQDRGVQVDAWDVQPTSHDTKLDSTMNEYHGCTPPFLEVKQCSKLPKVDNDKRALLLCYPPPGSSMAHDTLDMYLRNGGEFLIHIGEWKGLTGDNRFESLLNREMVCQWRHPCLPWGTDASHVTVWARDDKKSFASPLEALQPCSQCNVQEGTRRCRLLRSLVYCSQKCFEDDSDSRAKMLELQCIPLNPDVLSFANTKHFAPI